MWNMYCSSDYSLYFNFLKTCNAKSDILKQQQQQNLKTKPKTDRLHNDQSNKSSLWLFYMVALNEEIQLLFVFWYFYNMKGI